MEQGQQCIQNICCTCWTNGCGLDGAFGAIANGLEAINPCMEYIADCIWILGSPLAFPIVFLFPPAGDDATIPPGGGWSMSMLQTPLRRPLHCCLYTLCAPCGQWYARREALGRDMTKYKLWQGQHDGPQCLARRCPGAPITIQSGTYGEQDCPNAFLCLEVSILGGFCSICCAHNVTRRLIKDERNLTNDPTEERVDKCVAFFSQLAHNFMMCGICLCCASCLVGCCAPGSDGAQECSGEAGRAGRACRSCAMTCWRGIWSVQIIAIGCMATQQDYELHHAPPLAAKPAPVTKKMDRGAPTTVENNDNLDSNHAPGDAEDAWWKRPSY
jgi:hypothetical protein